MSKPVQAVVIPGAGMGTVISVHDPTVPNLYSVEYDSLLLPVELKYDA